MKTEYELKQKLREIVHEEFIDSWLDSPNPAFDNKTPRQMILEQNSDQIEMMIYRIGSGEPSG